MSLELVDRDYWESKTVRSKQNFERAKKSILGGIASFLHKAPYEEYPICIAYGKDSKIYDVDGNEYIDYMGAFGPMILGYCPEAVSKAVIEQIGRGTQYAAPTESLNELSEKLVEVIPCAELVSYQSTGTEACMGSFRFARAYTGKAKIIKFEGHYHGWSDEANMSVGVASLEQLGPRNRPWKVLQSAGQPEMSSQNMLVLPWNDLEIVKKTISRHGHEIAAIITEPIMCNCEPVFPKPGYLEGLRAITAENDILLIFDEIITGFRLSLGGAQRYYNVVPDISTFGKAAGGGFQIAGVVGKREIMETGVHPTGTFSANPVAVTASLATIRELEKPGVYEHMAKITRRLTEGIREIAKTTHTRSYCDGLESIWQLAFGITEPMNDYRDNFRVDKAAYQRFRMASLARGIRFHPSRGRFYVSTAHTDADVDKTLSVVEELFSKMFKNA